MKHHLLYSDLEILLNLLAPAEFELHIFDPDGQLNYDREPNASLGHAHDFKVLVSLVPQIDSFKGRSLDEFDLVLDFGKSHLSSNFERKDFSYIAAPEKHLRWIYPSDATRPTFLNFYSAATFRAKLISTMIKATFAVGLKRWLQDGQFTVWHQHALKLEYHLKTVSYDAFSIFMGTPGFMRSVLVGLEQQGKVSQYVKIPVTPHARFLQQNERQTLRKLQAKQWDGMRVPVAHASSQPDLLIQDNVKPTRAKRSQRFTALHERFIAQGLEQSHLKQKVRSTLFWEAIMTNLAMVRQLLPEQSNILYLYDRLEAVKQSIDQKAMISTALMHGDFTPWNVWMNKEELAVYDWELSRGSAPALYDLFHFHFQSGLFLHQESFEKTWWKIEESLESSGIQPLLQKHQIDTELHFRLYLLHKVSYQLACALSDRSQLEKIEAALPYWITAFEAIHAGAPKASQREQFMQVFHEFLQRRSHVFLKAAEHDLEDFSKHSDWDLLVTKEDLNAYLNFCQNHRMVKRAKVYKKSFMTTIELFFADSSFMSLDLLHALQRKNLNLLAPEILLRSAQLEGNISKSDPRFDLEYCLLFYQLNGASIPVKYQRYFKRLSFGAQEKMLQYINEKYQLKASTIHELFQHQQESSQTLRAFVKARPENGGRHKIIQRLQYWKDTLMDVRKRRGFIITFSGVDGAGKTTVIGAFKSQLEEKFRRQVVLLRHRPGILPMLSAYRHGKEEAERRATVHLPRQGTNRSALSSFVRFSYYYADYLLGQTYVLFRYLIRGKIVVYDRYYFDFINDARRSNIHLPAGLVRFLYRFVAKPRLNYFLYADAQTILERKQELPADDIQELTGKYIRLFERLDERYADSQYRIIENIDLGTTLNLLDQDFSEAA